MEIGERHKKTGNYQVVAEFDYPRYTFQNNWLEAGFLPEDGLWCSYHFTPGNYEDPPNTPSRETVHGKDVANYFPEFMKRDTNGGRDVLTKSYSEDKAAQYLADLQFGKLLNRPQSALSRQIIMDAIKCATNDARLESIFSHAKGGHEILNNNREDNLRRFKLILLGVRAHVIADTWAHQDFCGLNNVMNTYWDVNYEPSSWQNPLSLLNPSKWRQSIEYDDGTTSGWKNQVLSYSEAKIGRLSKNFEATPNATSYLGHGWMGHLPDFSFVKFRYKPCWANPETAIERDNPKEYQSAWVELVSLFTQAKGKGQLNPTDGEFKNDLDKAKEAIQSPHKLASRDTGRKSSANAWQKAFNNLSSPNIDVDLEPDSKTVLDGIVEKIETIPLDITDRYGTYFVNISSDLYLFQIAADYHFHFVKKYLERHNIYKFSGRLSQKENALSPGVSSHSR